MLASGMPSDAPEPPAPRIATAMSGPPGSIFIAVSATRTSDWARTCLNTPRAGVGVTRACVANSLSH